VFHASWSESLDNSLPLRSARAPGKDCRDDIGPQSHFRFPSRRRLQQPFNSSERLSLAAPLGRCFDLLQFLGREPGRYSLATIKGFEVMRMIRRGQCITCKPYVKDEVSFINMLFDTFTIAA